ncbi:LPXTG cell wall anchor domain-containing protein [Staphylococcus sp. 11261D007BR]
MKKVGLLATTAFASTLLFTGINANEANAAENELSDAQIESIAKEYFDNTNIQLIMPDSYGIYREASGPEGYTPVYFGEEGHNGPSGIFVNNITGEVLDYQADKHQFNNDATEATNQPQEQTPSAEQNVNTQANNTGAETASAPQQEEATQEQAMLPETGGEASNSTMITIIASLFIAAGSFLTFKRRSKQK